MWAPSQTTEVWKATKSVCFSESVALQSWVIPGDLSVSVQEPGGRGVGNRPLMWGGGVFEDTSGAAWSAWPSHVSEASLSVPIKASLPSTPASSAACQLSLWSSLGLRSCTRSVDLASAGTLVAQKSEVCTKFMACSVFVCVLNKRTSLKLHSYNLHARAACLCCRLLSADGFSRSDLFWVKGLWCIMLWSSQS